MKEFNYLNLDRHLDEADSFEQEAHIARLDGKDAEADELMKMCEEHKALAAEIKAQLKADPLKVPSPDPRWIPWPSDPPPEDCQRVIVTWPEADFAPWEAFYMGDADFGTPGFYRPDRGCYDEHMRMDGVIAWMPWPENYNP
jgi:hypothetical protein